jgi:pyruvate/2-oxoglutarate dehydrogenase complex dihydrolipoamide dehydrogenase (E3) component
MHHARIAPTFRKGRVLLAGDAAHLMPVWQGQGFNTGIRDATNLGWKLALSVRGTAAPGLLDTYTQERHAHAGAMIDLSVLVGKIFVPATPMLRAVRNVAGPLLSRIGPVRRYIAEMRFKPMPFFADGGVVHPGVPDPKGAVGKVFVPPRVADAAGRVDFAAVMQRVHRVIRDIEPHDSIERYTGLGVEVLQGHARITSPWVVEVTLADGSTQTLTTKNIVIAAGASPFVPPIPGLKEAGFLTSDTVWGLTELPKRLVVLGGGPIGSELAQSFARLGSAVTQVEMAPRIMGREDPEVSELVTASLRADGVNVLTEHQAVRVEVVPGAQGPEKRLIAKTSAQAGGAEVVIPFDELLCAVGRSPRVTGYGLEELGIPLTPRKTIETNAYLQTLYPNIYAVGDVAGPFQFTHTAAHQAWYAAVNALFGRLRKFKADYRVIPWATFTDPEVARVGLSETEAKEQGVAYEVTRYGIEDLDRAIADGTAHGFVKVLTVPGKDRILGVTIVGEHAGDLLAEYVLAMKHGLGLNKILGTIHIYPTMAEANKYAAGEWKRAHAPHKLLKWVERYHAWERA